MSPPRVRRRGRSRSRQPLTVESRPVPLVLRSAHECLTAYEVDYARKIFARMCCAGDDGDSGDDCDTISFRGFLKLSARMSPHLARQRGFAHRAAYHFRLADSDCDGRISFEEFLFAYVRSRDAAAAAASAGSIGALDTGCAMNERPARVRRTSSSRLASERSRSPSPTTRFFPRPSARPRRRASSYRFGSFFVTQCPISTNLIKPCSQSQDLRLCAYMLIMFVCN